MSPGERNNKITPEHLRKNAYLYIRQSTLHQVLENTESTRRQYELRQRAVVLGWPEERIVVIDSDLGQSGASAKDREGFQRLVGEVGTGRAGIVMGLEVSRLARNSSDWHRLLEICALSSTLILDEDGIYDPAHFNDRLLLGLNSPSPYSTSRCMSVVSTTKNPTRQSICHVGITDLSQNLLIRQVSPSMPVMPNRCNGFVDLDATAARDVEYVLRT